MLQILRGMTYKGNCKYPCCFCLYNNYEKDRHNVTNWPERNSFAIGEFNVANMPLVEACNIVLPVLHIKLGLVKQFVKYMHRDSPAFQAVNEMFPR